MSTRADPVAAIDDVYLTDLAETAAYSADPSSDAVDPAAVCVGWREIKWAFVGTPDETARLLAGMVRCAQVCLEHEDLGYFAGYLVATHISALIRYYAEWARYDAPVDNLSAATKIYTDLQYLPRELRAKLGAEYFARTPGTTYCQYTGCPLAEFLAPPARGRAYARVARDEAKAQFLPSLLAVFTDVDRDRVRAALADIEAAAAWTRGLDDLSLQGEAGRAALGPHPSALELAGFLATICGGSAMGGVQAVVACLCGDVVTELGRDVRAAIQGSLDRPLFAPEGVPPSSKRYYDGYINEYVARRLTARAARAGVASAPRCHRGKHQ